MPAERRQRREAWIMLAAHPVFLYSCMGKHNHLIEVLKCVSLGVSHSAGWICDVARKGQRPLTRSVHTFSKARTSELEMHGLL